MKKAFTLLEMLVVIGIIGILVALGTTSYSTIQKKARDARRHSDLKTIQSALEQYYSICNYQYPTLGATSLSGTIAATTLAGCNSDTTILTIPTDPLGGNYQCIGNCNSNEYLICPKVVTTGKYMESEDCTTDNQVCCLKNQQ